MIGAFIYEPMPGNPFLRIIEAENHFRDIPLEAISTWRELLGIDDPLEALEAIIHVQDHGEPAHDPVTGKNVWTEAYQLLRRREEAREDAAAQAVEDGCDQAEVVARAEQAAYDAVHTPINGGECALDRCRREARAKLGLPDPARKCGVGTKTTAPPVPESQPAALRVMRPAGGKAQVMDLLADQGEYLLECTQAFLHQLSGHDTDHVTPPPPEPEPEPDAVILTADELLTKYQEAP